MDRHSAAAAAERRGERPPGGRLGCKDPPTNGGLHASATAPAATARSRRGVAELLHMLAAGQRVGLIQLCAERENDADCVTSGRRSAHSSQRDTGKRPHSSPRALATYRSCSAFCPSALHQINPFCRSRPNSGVPGSPGEVSDELVQGLGPGHRRADIASPSAGADRPAFRS